MASVGTLTIRFDSSAKQFQELLEALGELFDMVPDWRAPERDEAAKCIHALLTQMTNVDYTKEPDDG